MGCKREIKNLVKVWEQKGNSWNCSIYCFCRECHFMEVSEGAKIEVWQQITKIGEMTKSGIIDIKDPTDILLEF